MLDFAAMASPVALSWGGEVGCNVEANRGPQAKRLEVHG
jgi:hypothetical protein